MSVASVDGTSATHGIGRGWVRFTSAAMAVIFLQSLTAGRILSGDHWARTTHRAVAGLLVLAVLGAGVAALAVLRDRPGGRQLAVAFLTLAACLVAEYALGAAAAEGDDTVWLHIPFGVALVAVAAQANRLARRLAEPDTRPTERTFHG